MKKIILLFLTSSLLNVAKAQNVFIDNFSTFNNAKLDGQNGWSSNTPNLGNGSGACFSFGCNVLVATKTLTYPSVDVCTKAINPIDGVLATGDGPGKSVGTAINSGSVYVALLVNFTQPSASTSPNGNKQVIRFMDNGFTSATRIYIKQFAAGAFQIGIDKNNSAVSFSSSTFAYGVDHLIILKYKFNTTSTTDDEAAVFIDPDLSLPEPAPVVSLTGLADATSITRVVFPWNSTSIIPSGFYGIVSVSKDWSSNLLPIAGVNNVTLTKTQNTKANLKWTVENGATINNFEVQQSTDRINFKTIATISNTGDKVYNQEIELTKGVTYVRLASLEKNGKKTIGNILSIKNNSELLKDIQLAPNPASSNLSITIFTTIPKKITTEIIDVFGKTVLKSLKQIEVGETNFTTNIAALKVGNYFVKITSNLGDIQTAKFIKQ